MFIIDNMSKQKIFYLMLLVGVVGVVFLSIGILMKPENTREEPKEIKNDQELSTNITQPKESAEKELFTLTKEIWADIGGAVLRPGVYALEVKGDQQPRMFELVKKAGGFRNDANQAYLAKNFNLAVTLSDAQKVYIPFDWENESTVINTSSTGGSEGGQSEQKISMNTANLTQLQTLRGVGEVRAQAIVEGRPYSSLEELVERKIIPQSVLDNNNEIISI